MLFRSHVRNFVENGVSEAAGADPDAGPEPGTTKYRPITILFY